MKQITKHYLAIITLSLALTVLTLTGGCATMSGKQGPTKFETVLFETKTNYVEEVVVVQEEVWTTNVVEEVIVNESNITVTNFVETVDVQVNYVTETNVVEVFEHTVKDEVKADAAIVGGVINTFAPGVGGLVSSLLIGGLGVWARMRSYKKSGTVLAQNIEAIREFIKTSVPDGQVYDQALVKFMKEHQTEAGAVNNVMLLLQKYVRNKDAKEGAQEIQGLINSLKQT